MPYISPENVRKAKEIDLLTYLQIYDPDELVRISPNVFSTKTHDSLKISNGMWMWWSRGFGGKNALDYLVKVKGLSFYQAISDLLNLTDKIPSVTLSNHAETKIKELILPQRAPNNDMAIRYLKKRGIAQNIIAHCISNGSVYESMPMHNLVFVGFDDENIPKYAGLRGTTDRRFLGEAEGSNKEFSFRLVNENAKNIHIFESAIDLLSYATLLQLNGIDWRTHNLIALAGVYKPSQYKESEKLPTAIKSFLDKNKNIETIYLHLDNDAAGRIAASSFMRLLSEKYTVINKPPPRGKDMNDYLCYSLNLPYKTISEGRYCR